MPWCPNCKTEYREGITHCADCKVELVEEYKDAVLQNATEMLVKIDKQHDPFAKKLFDFLAYSEIPCVALDEGDMIGIYVAPEDFKKAKKCFKAFYSVEAEAIMQQTEEAAFLKGEEYNDYFGDDEEEDEEVFDDTPECSENELPTYTDDVKAAGYLEKNKEKLYVSAVTRYDDYRSSGFTFTILGGFGIVFAVLNFMEVITLFGSTFSSLVLFLMFGIFLALGVFSFVKAGSLKEGAELEKKTVAEVNAWMEKNFTRDMLVSSSDDNEDAEVKTEELLYMDRLDQLVGRVLHEFPDLHDSLAEQLVDEFFGQ